MIVVICIAVLLLLPNLTDYLKIGTYFLFKVLEFIVVYGTFPALFYISVALKMKGH